MHSRGSDAWRVIREISILFTEFHVRHRDLKFFFAKYLVKALKTGLLEGVCWAKIPLTKKSDNFNVSFDFSRAEFHFFRAHYCSFIGYKFVGIQKTNFTITFQVFFRFSTFSSRSKIQDSSKFFTCDFFFTH